jgi:hypothetical protein
MPRIARALEPITPHRNTSPVNESAIVNTAQKQFGAAGPENSLK